MFCILFPWKESLCRMTKSVCQPCTPGGGQVMRMILTGDSPRIAGFHIKSWGKSKSLICRSWTKRGEIMCVCVWVGCVCVCDDRES